ncbi:protoheme IX farnesyltransferase [Acidisoma cellulosilytica]|uniref:Protoheme IX farnesyltransferase n=1 Tax=Acidisoma cellulosilyticum TaxID=2802395 RepID=A0A963Z0V5_9PROT|nr:heme o synthase [Acidisoma cellulosilyticum]MCB8880645.1 protoheme IX farnesyltransferase [Acidisoma cellulosilyticum]
MEKPATAIAAERSLPLSPELADWIALLKPRVMSLVVFAGAIGMLLAPGHINPLVAVGAVVCIAIGAGAAGAINMWYDRDIDAVMRRTANRPIPAGRMAPLPALIYGIVLSVISVIAMFVLTNWVAAGMLAVSIAFYVLIYTMWLKRRTPQNIVIGGAAGAFPPIIGWAAVTGSIDLVPILMFAITFFWTPPHFWSLSLYASGDYERAGVPMLPVVRGPRITRINILVYTLILLPVAASPWMVGFVGLPYLVISLILSGFFIYYAVRVMQDGRGPGGDTVSDNAPARKAFRFSLLYLFLLFLALAVCHAIP